MASVDSFRVKEFCFVWRLEKLFLLLENTDHICSPGIRINSNSTIQFMLTLQEDKFVFSIIEDFNLKIALNDCDIIFKVDSPAVFDLRFSKSRDDTLHGWIFSSLSPLSESRKKKYASGDLVISCHLFLGEPVLPVSENKRVQDIDFWKLSRDLQKIRESGSCSDLDLIVNEDSFKVHKALLAARSPELLAQIEIQSSLLSVERFSAPVLRVILQYLYTGKVSQDNLIIPEGLLPVLDSLKLDRLKDKFCSFPSEVEAVTRIAQAQTSFTWPLKNISRVNLQSPTLVRLSPWLCSSASEQGQIELCLELIPSEDGVFINVSVRWHYEQPPTRSSSVVSKTSVVDIFGELQHSYECEFLLEPTEFLEDTSSWKVVFSVQKTLLTRDSDILLPDDSLSLLFDFKTSTQSEVVTKNVYPMDSFSEITFGREDIQQLSSDLNKLLVSDEYSDITLRLGKKHFKVHKFILLARVPKLLDIIKNHPLTGIDENILEILIKYIYTAELPELTCSLAMKLYFAAYKYDITLLKRKCLDIVKKKLTF